MLCPRNNSWSLSYKGLGTDKVWVQTPAPAPSSTTSLSPSFCRMGINNRTLPYRTNMGANASKICDNQCSGLHEPQNTAEIQKSVITIPWNYTSPWPGLWNKSFKRRWTRFHPSNVSGSIWRPGRSYGFQSGYTQALWAMKYFCYLRDDFAMDLKIQCCSSYSFLLAAIGALSFWEVTGHHQRHTLPGYFRS